MQTFFLFFFLGIADAEAKQHKLWLTSAEIIYAPEPLYASSQEGAAWLLGFLHICQLIYRSGVKSNAQIKHLCHSLKSLLLHKPINWLHQSMEVFPPFVSNRCNLWWKHFRATKDGADSSSSIFLGWNVDVSMKQEERHTLMFSKAYQRIRNHSWQVPENRVEASITCDPLPLPENIHIHM